MNKDKDLTIDLDLEEEEIEGYVYCDTKKQICLNDCGNQYPDNHAWKSDLH